MLIFNTTQPARLTQHDCETMRRSNLISILPFSSIFTFMPRMMTIVFSLWTLVFFCSGAQAAPTKKAAEAKALSAKNVATGGAQSLGTFGEWGAYVGGSGNAKVCFILSQPKERLPKALARDPAYIFISFRPAQGIKNEIAINMGYGLKPLSEPSATIGSNNFGMVAKDKNAFLKNAAEENQFVEAAKRASSLMVKGKSARGNETTDRYVLTGFGQALERAVKECQ